MTKKASLFHFMVIYAAEYQDELLKNSDVPSQSARRYMRVQSKKVVCMMTNFEDIPDPVKIRHKKRR